MKRMRGACKCAAVAAAGTYRYGVGDGAAEVAEAGVRRAGGGGGLWRAAAGGAGPLHGAGWRGVARSGRHCRRGRSRPRVT